MTASPVVTLPLSPRVAALKAALRRVDTGTMEPWEVQAHCERAVPGCTTPEITAALHLVADEEAREAELLRVLGTLLREPPGWPEGKTLREAAALHGMTVAEAVALAKQRLAEKLRSPSR